MEKERDDYADNALAGKSLLAKSWLRIVVVIVTTGVAHITRIFTISFFGCWTVQF